MWLIRVYLPGPSVRLHVRPKTIKYSEKQAINYGAFTISDRYLRFQYLKNHSTRLSFFSITSVSASTIKLRMLKKSVYIVFIVHVPLEIRSSSRLYSNPFQSTDFSRRSRVLSPTSTCTAT